MVASRTIQWEDLVLVGTIVRPHGLHGQVLVHPETDFVEERFRPGAGFRTRGPGGEDQLTVTSARVQGRRPVVGFEGVATVEDAERLVGVELRVPEDALLPLPDGAYYHHQLVGCAVDAVSGEQVGQVVRVSGGAGGSLLVVEGPRGEVLVPLAVDICVEVDVHARRIRIAPPAGLLELNQARPRRPAATDPAERASGEATGGG